MLINFNEIIAFSELPALSSAHSTAHLLQGPHLLRLPRAAGAHVALARRITNRHQEDRVKLCIESMS